MVSVIQEYRLNGRDFSLDLTEVGEMSAESKDVFTKLGVSLPPPLKGGAGLQDRVRSIQDTAQMLQEAKEHSVRDKALAVLKTALLVALVAGIIAACVFGGEAGVILGLVMGLICYATVSLTLYLESGEKIVNIENKLPDYERPWYLPEEFGDRERDINPVVGLLGGGFIMPLFEAFTRTSRLERVLQKQRESLNATLTHCKEKNDRLLPLASEFCQTESARIDGAFAKKIGQLQQHLATMRAEGSEEWEKVFEKRIAEHQKAKAEWDAMVDFYKPFHSL